mgnify:CR=1 FL=1
MPPKGKAVPVDEQVAKALAALKEASGNAAAQAKALESLAAVISEEGGAAALLSSTALEEVGAALRQAVEAPLTPRKRVPTGRGVRGDTIVRKQRSPVGEAAPYMVGESGLFNSA